MAVDIEFLKSIGLEDESVAQKIAAKAAEDELGLVAKRDELLGKVTTYKDQLKQFEGVNLDEYSQLKKRMSEIEEKNLMDKGEFDKILAKKEEEWQARVESESTVKESIANQLREILEDKSILAAVGDRGDGETVLDVIKRRGWVKSVDTEDGIVVKVTSMDGSKELDSVKDLIDEMAKSEKYARLFNSSGLSGSGSKPSGSGSKTVDGSVWGAKRMAAARQA